MKINRDKIMEELTQKWLDAIDLDGLMDYFRDGQMAFLDDQSDADLVTLAKENDVEVEE